MVEAGSLSGVRAGKVVLSLWSRAAGRGDGRPEHRLGPGRGMWHGTPVHALDHNLVNISPLVGGICDSRDSVGRIGVSSSGAPTPFPAPAPRPHPACSPSRSSPPAPRAAGRRRPARTPGVRRPRCSSRRGAATPTSRPAGARASSSGGDRCRCASPAPRTVAGRSYEAGTWTSPWAAPGVRRHRPDPDVGGDHARQEPGPRRGARPARADGTTGTLGHRSPTGRATRAPSRARRTPGRPTTSAGSASTPGAPPAPSPPGRCG